MKLQSTPKLLLTLVVTLIVTFQAATPVSAALTDGLVAYWPLDEITGCNNRTPEVVNGYDLQPYFGGAHILTNFGPDTVYLTNDAVRGNAFFWPNPANGNNRSLLGFISTSTNDLVPVNRYSPTNFTVSFWVKTDNTKNDIRIWTEGNINNNNPGIDIGATGSSWDFFQRQQGLGAPFLEQGDNHTLGGLIAFEFEPTWHNITLVQEGNDPATNTAVRRIYVDGMLDPIPLPNKNPGLWDLNTVAVGGWLRAGVAATVSMFNGAIDEVAVWSRALSEEEIAQYIAEGITNEFTTTAPLQIAFFESDLGLIDHGDSVTLTWNASPDVTGLFIDNGVGDVLPVSTCGAGSITVVPTGSTVYTLTATRGTEVQTATVSVQSVPPVDGWKTIDTFTLSEPGELGNQGNWTTVAAGFSGPHNQPHVLSSPDGSNKFIGLDGDHLATAAFLGANSVGAGQSNTLFFRFYIDPSINDMDPETTIIPDVDIYVGIGNKQIVDEFNYRNGANGPEIQIFRSTFGTGGPIDLIAANGSGTGLFFQYLFVNPEGLQVGKVYNVWIDVYNTNNDNTIPASAYYSVHIQREDEPTRTTLFTDFVTGDAPGAETYDRVHIAASQNTTPQGTNVVFFDDFYLSANGYNASVPVPAGSFVVGTPAAPAGITISPTVIRTGNSTTISWTPAPAGSYSYTVQRRTSLTSGDWVTVGSAITGTTFTDTTAASGMHFYRVTSP